MKYTAETYAGNKIGNSGFNYRLGVQIVATDDTGNRRAVFATQRGKSPCLKLWEGAAHYKSGLNKADSARCAEELKKAEKLAKQWTKAGTHK